MIFKKSRVLLQTLGLWVCLSGQAFGQGYYDSAIRFGQGSIFGSNRAVGMGGVQMATGADGAAGGANPASPAMLRRSDIQLSLVPTFNSSNSSFLGNEISASKSRTPISSFSLALANMKDDVEAGDFRGGTFYLSYNRTAIFDYKNNWEGTHLLSPRPGDTTSNSLISYYLDNLNKPGLYPSDILYKPGYDDISLAYRTYLLDVNQNRFVSVIPLGNVRQKGSYDQTLTQGSWNVGYSVNWKDKIYVGANLGIYRGDYSSKLQYGEIQETVVVNPNNPNFSYLQGFKGFNFQVNKNLSQQSRGVNGNIGILVKVTEGLRLGASVQTPTSTKMTETYDSRFTANYNGIAYWFNDPQNPYSLNTEDSAAPTNIYEWTLVTPAKYRAGASYIFGKQGMVGIDLEYTDLSKTKLKNGDGNYNFLEENKVIKNNYVSTLNVKIGGEIRVEDFRFRLGYAYFPTPLKSGSAYTNNIPTDTHYFTGGVGGRYETWYWDTALVLGFWKTKYTYVPEIMPTVESKINSTQIRLGVGAYF